MTNHKLRVTWTENGVIVYPLLFNASFPEISSGFQFSRDFIWFSLLTTKASLFSSWILSILLSLTLFCCSLTPSLALHFSRSWSQVLSWWISAAFLGERQKGSLECCRCREIMVCFPKSEWQLLGPCTWAVMWVVLTCTPVGTLRRCSPDQQGCLTRSDLCL